MANVHPIRDVENGTEVVTYKPQQPNQGKSLRIALIISIILGCVFLIALIVVLTLGKKPCKPTPSDVCYEDRCIATAARLVEAMNRSVDPCEDFYEFSCGTWIANNQKDNGDRMFDRAIEESRKEIKGYIRKEMKNKKSPKCVKKILQALKVCSEFTMKNLKEKDYLLPLTSALESIGGWPMIDKQSRGKAYGWKELISRARSHLYSLLPIKLEVFTDPTDTEHSVFYVSEPSEFKLLDLDLLQTVARLLGHKDNSSIAADVKEVNEFIETLKNITQKGESEEYEGEEEAEEEDDEVGEEEEGDANEVPTSITIDEMNKILPEVDWLKLLNDSFYELMYPIGHRNINNNSKIFVTGDDVPYLRTVIQMLENGEISTRVLANYLASKFIEDAVTSQASDTELSEIGLKSTVPIRHISFPESNEKQWNKCFNYLMSIVSPIFDYISGKHRDAKFIDENIFNYSFVAMKEMIDESTWLDEETKGKVHEKLREIIHFSGYPEWTKDPKELEAYFLMLPNMSSTNTFENRLLINKFVEGKKAQMLLQNHDRKKWPKLSILSGSSMNAFNYLPYNIIVITAGIQRYPYFYHDRPMYMNFGGLGLILGHEIIHSFDLSGSMRDKHGNLDNWWTEKAREEFDTRAQCVINQYSSYKYGDKKDTHIDGEKTVSENIADNGGIRQAFLAYKKWEKDHGKEKSVPGLEEYTPYQLLFISFARSWCESYNPPAVLAALHADDDHAADRFRIIGSLSNMKEFSEVFDCKPDSKMNPSNKCVVW